MLLITPIYRAWHLNLSLFNSIRSDEQCMGGGGGHKSRFDEGTTRLTANHVLRKREHLFHVSRQKGGGRGEGRQRKSEGKIGN